MYKNKEPWLYFKNMKMKTLMFFMLINLIIISVLFLIYEIKKNSNKLNREILSINKHLKNFEEEKLNSVFKHIHTDPSISNICIYMHGKIYKKYTNEYSDKKCPEKLIENKEKLNPKYLHVSFNNPEKYSHIFIRQNLKNTYVNIIYITIAGILTILISCIIMNIIYYKLYKTALETTNEKINLIDSKYKNLKYQNEDLNRMSQIINRENYFFLRKISYEILSHLHSINSFSIYGINEINNKSSADLKYFCKIKNVTLKLLNTTNNLLHLTSIDSEEDIFFMKKNDISEIIKLSIETQKSILKEKISIEIIKEKNCNSSAVFDKEKMLLLFNNIITNSVKFSSKKATLLIKLSNDYKNLNSVILKPPALYIEILSDSMEISEKEISNLFVRINQNNTNKKNNDLEIGYYICKNIIERHNGKIIAKSDKENGIKIIISIPCNLEAGKTTNTKQI